LSAVVAFQPTTMSAPKAANGSKADMVGKGRKRRSLPEADMATAREFGSLVWKTVPSTRPANRARGLLPVAAGIGKLRQELPSGHGHGDYSKSELGDAVTSTRPGHLDMARNVGTQRRPSPRIPAFDGFARNFAVRNRMSVSLYGAFRHGCDEQSNSRRQQPWIVAQGPDAGVWPVLRAAMLKSSSL
jgi:hypothetical protein